jgi:hypothetical protein
MSDQQSAAATSANGVNVRQEVADALFLLDYAVANGIKTKDGTPLPDGIAATLKGSAEKLGLLDGGAGGPVKLTAADWAAFEEAYYDLSTALAPITAETLRNTQSKSYRERTWCEHIIGDCSALRFTRLLWLLTLLFAAFVIGSSWYLNVMAVVGDTNSDPYLVWRTFFGLLTPWAYGGLGACVYLLRSAHVFIYQRSFDVHHKPEYFNRIVLGAVAGGAILLFVDHLTNDEGQVVQLSSAALGFLAGYNTDFLFTAIERISAAILPKVGIDTVQTAKAGTQPVNINDLAERMDKAQGADKEMYRALIARLTGTRTPPSGS